MSASLFWFAALFLFLSNGALITHQQDQTPVLWWCYDSAGNYTANSLYETNLEVALLPSLASNAIRNFTTYYSNNAGRDPDRVYGFAQCMSQSSVDDCRACLNISASAISNFCPNRRQAFLRYEDCTIRYSNQSFVSQLDASFFIHYRNSENATQLALFSQQRGSLLRNLTRASAQSPSRLAAGSTQFNDLSNIYGMAQCTRDISSIDCLSCLKQILPRIDNSVGARIYFASCSVRYEIYPFYPADGFTPPSPPPLVSSRVGEK